jgi:4-alpha-glucanotransferase
VLLHPSSLAGPEPIGTFGAESEAWVDWLATTGAGIWQVLPLTINGKDESPYFGTSAFATNHWLIDLRELERHGLLDRFEPPAGADGPIDFGAMRAWKRPLLLAAASAFLADPRHSWRSDYDRFVATSDWLADACHFFALQDAQPGTPWWEWDEPLRRRDPRAVAASAAELDEEIERWQVLQFFAERQWQRVRRRANDAGILVLGDIPIYVAPDSADVWVHQDQFELDAADGRMTVQSGVPPDYFSATGQLWGNPLYRWDAMAADGFTWWIARLRRTLEQTDLVRIDHFRALSAYWSVPASHDTAVHGAWVSGPGQAFVDAVRAAFPDLPIVAEDLGDLDEAVLTLRDRNDLLGMRVLQFGFDGDAPNDHHPCRIVERCVVYTGTHDNDTLAGWWESLGRRQRERVRADTDMPARVRTRGAVWWLIDVVLRTPAVAAIIPVQDLLVLGSEARMNIPGTVVENWRWRMPAGSLVPRLATELRSLAEQSRRSRPHRD